jgi:hypothetical protein
MQDVLDVSFSIDVSESESVITYLQLTFVVDRNVHVTSFQLSPTSMSVFI